MTQLAYTLLVALVLTITIANITAYANNKEKITPENDKKEYKKSRFSIQKYEYR